MAANIGVGFDVQDSGLREQRSEVRVPHQLLSRNVERFRGGLVFKAHRLLHHSTLGSSVIKKKKKKPYHGGSLGRRAVGRGREGDREWRDTRGVVS